MKISLMYTTLTWRNRTSKEVVFFSLNFYIYFKLCFKFLFFSPPRNFIQNRNNPAAGNRQLSSMYLHRRCQRKRFTASYVQPPQLSATGFARSVRHNRILMDLNLYIIWKSNFHLWIIYALLLLIVVSDRSIIVHMRRLCKELSSHRLNKFPLEREHKNDLAIKMNQKIRKQKTKL